MTRWILVRVRVIEAPDTGPPRTRAERYGLLGRDRRDPGRATLCCDLGGSRWSAVPGAYDAEERLFNGSTTTGVKVVARVVAEVESLPLEDFASDFFRTASGLRVSRPA